ncbi:MAG: hypothetical protein WDO12_06725 [Pseudomonadota bacterium]
MSGVVVSASVDQLPSSFLNTGIRCSCEPSARAEKITGWPPSASSACWVSVKRMRSRFMACSFRQAGIRGAEHEGTEHGLERQWMRFIERGQRHCRNRQRLVFEEGIAGGTPMETVTPLSTARSAAPDGTCVVAIGGAGDVEGGTPHRRQA